MTLRIGSLFSGAGGLDQAFHLAYPDSETAWFCEYDPAPSAVLAHHYPDIPNLGDVTTVDWDDVPSIDVLLAGFPCQDVSLCGARAGMAEGTRSGLWSYVVTAIEHLNPSLLIVENVRGLLSAKATRPLEPGDDGLAERPALRALGAVLGDLADLGFDAEWGMFPASAIGAPHRRDRVFLAAAPKRIVDISRAPADPARE